MQRMELVMHMIHGDNFVTTALVRTAQHCTSLYVQLVLALRPVQGGLDMLGLLEGFEGPGTTGPHET